LLRNESSGEKERVYHVTVSISPTFHMVFASGLVIGGSYTVREVNGIAWI
jgi:hypothetical protein